MQRAPFSHCNRRYDAITGPWTTVRFRRGRLPRCGSRKTARVRRTELRRRCGSSAGSSSTTLNIAHVASGGERDGVRVSSPGAPVRPRFLRAVERALAKFDALDRERSSSASLSASRSSSRHSEPLRCGRSCSSRATTGGMCTTSSHPRPGFRELGQERDPSATTYAQDAAGRRYAWQGKPVT